MDYKHFYIKNMVCEHCAEVLESKLTEAGLPVSHLELGKVELQRPVNAEEFTKLHEIIDANGFEIISDRSSFSTITALKTANDHKQPCEHDKRGNGNQYKLNSGHDKYILVYITKGNTQTSINGNILAWLTHVVTTLCTL